MKIDLVFLIVLGIVVAYIFVLHKVESMADVGSLDQIKEAVKQVYLADVEAIRNLSSVASKLTATGLTVPGQLKVADKISTNNLDPNNMPDGWGGGLRIFDGYSSGTMGFGPDGKKLNAYMNANGDLMANIINTPSLTRIGGDWLRINNGGVGRTALYGNLSINDAPGGNSGLAVGSWNDKVGQGSIAASGDVSCGGNIVANGSLKVGGWTIRDNNGRLEFLRDNDRKYSFDPSGDMMQFKFFNLGSFDYGGCNSGRREVRFATREQGGDGVFGNQYAPFKIC